MQILYFPVGSLTVGEGGFRLTVGKRAVHVKQVSILHSGILGGGLVQVEMKGYVLGTLFWVFQVVRANGAFTAYEIDQFCGGQPIGRLGVLRNVVRVFMTFDDQGHGSIFHRGLAGPSFVLRGASQFVETSVKRIRLLDGVDDHRGAQVADGERGSVGVVYSDCHGDFFFVSCACVSVFIQRFVYSVIQGVINDGYVSSRFFDYSGRQGYMTQAA